MDLITGAEIAAIETRLEDLDPMPLPPELKQLLIAAALPKIYQAILDNIETDEP
jgi:hypothetical protein